MFAATGIRVSADNGDRASVTPSDTIAAPVTERADPASLKWVIQRWTPTYSIWSNHSRAYGVASEA